MAFDGDAIVVVDPAEIGQLEMTGERSRLATDTFHHVAVAAKRIDVVIEHGEVRTIEMDRHPLSCDRHTHARGNTLSKWTSGGLDA